jgi:kinetochore protein Nuf2
MNHSVLTEKNNVTQLEKKDRDLSTKIEMTNFVESDVVSCIKLLEQCLEENKRLESVKQKILTEKEAIDRKTGEMKELAVREQVRIFYS